MWRKIDAIEAAVTVNDVLSLHGIKARGKRLACPFCHGHGRPLSISDKYYHCFACGIGGGVIQLEQLFTGLDITGACRSLARAFGININFRKPTKEERENWKLNRKMEKDYENYEEEKLRYYRGLSRLYRNIYKEIEEGSDDPLLLELESSLSSWLDDNIEEVTQEWTLEISKWTTSLMEQSRLSSSTRNATT